MAGGERDFSRTLYYISTEIYVQSLPTIHLGRSLLVMLAEVFSARRLPG